MNPVTRHQHHDFPGHEPTWLAPTAMDRRRIVEMAARLEPAMGATALAWVAGTIASWLLTPGHAWWIFVPLVLGAASGPVLGIGLPRARRPEYLDAIQGLLLMSTTAVAAALTGGVTSPMTLLIPIGTFIGAARSTTLVTGLINGITIVLFAGTDLIFGVAHPHEQLRTAEFALVIIAIAMIGRALASAERESRKASVLDPLTGLLNRSGLESRFEELRQQTALNQASICLVLFDLDQFKAINDTHGHDAGDAVLRELAVRIRSAGRRFDSLYRLGGEEFLLVLPGIDEVLGVEHAEHLRMAIARKPIAGLPVTASFGVSAISGTEATLEQLYAQADEALYRAKHEGRDRTCGASGLTEARVAPSTPFHR